MHVSDERLQKPYTLLYTPLRLGQLQPLLFGLLELRAQRLELRVSLGELGVAVLHGVEAGDARLHLALRLRTRLDLSLETLEAARLVRVKVRG